MTDGFQQLLKIKKICGSVTIQSVVSPSVHFCPLLQQPSDAEIVHDDYPEDNNILPLVNNDNGIDFLVPQQELLVIDNNNNNDNNEDNFVENENDIVNSGPTIIERRNLIALPSVCFTMSVLYYESSLRCYPF